MQQWFVKTYCLAALLPALPNCMELFGKNLKSGLKGRRGKIVMMLHF